jgi:hypothetical protein
MSRWRLPKRITAYTKRKKRSGQTYEETDRWILRPEQANIGLHPWQLDDDDDDDDYDDDDDNDK